MISRLFEFELDWDVRPIDAVLETFYVATDVGLAVDQFAVVVLLWIFLLLVRENDVATEGLRHQEVLTESTRAASKHFVRVSRNNCTEGKDEVMNHLHVQEIGGY